MGGALVTQYVATFRKLFSIVASMLMYKKELTMHHLFGLFVFACACTVKLSRLKARSGGAAAGMGSLLGLTRKDSSLGLTKGSGFSLLDRKNSDESDEESANGGEEQPLIGPQVERRTSLSLTERSSMRGSPRRTKPKPEQARDPPWYSRQEEPLPATSARIQ